MHQLGTRGAFDSQRGAQQRSGSGTHLSPREPESEPGKEGTQREHGPNLNSVSASATAAPWRVPRPPILPIHLSLVLTSSRGFIVVLGITSRPLSPRALSIPPTLHSNVLTNPFRVFGRVQSLPLVSGPPRHPLEVPIASPIPPVRSTSSCFQRNILERPERGIYGLRRDSSCESSLLNKGLPSAEQLRLRHLERGALITSPELTISQLRFCKIVWTTTLGCADVY